MIVKFNFNCLDEGFEANWPVIVNMPDENGGTVHEEEFEARFKILSEEEHAAAVESDPYNGWINAFFVGLIEQELTDRVRKLMLARPNVRSAIINAYVKFCQGIPGKN